MLKVFGFLIKRADMDTQAFIDYYEKNHVPLICSLAPTPIVYKRNYLSRDDEFNKEDKAIDFDVVTELVFPDRAAYLAWRAQLSKPGSGEQIVADEEKVLDRSRTRACVIEECVTARLSLRQDSEQGKRRSVDRGRCGPGIQPRKRLAPECRRRCMEKRKVRVRHIACPSLA